LPAILYGCDTWSLTLRRALESRALREDIWKKRRAEWNCIMKMFMACSPYLRWPDRGGWNGRDVWQMGEERKCLRLTAGKPEWKTQLGKQGAYWRIILKWEESVEWINLDHNI
jgi:hypothetical protein